MSILIFYNLNHHYFRCDYRDNIATINYKKGRIDKFNRLYIQKINTSYTTFSKLKLPRYQIKRKIGDKLVEYGSKLSGKNQNTPRHNNNWYMWRK